MTDLIRDWNPAEGFACQGDVILIPVPVDIAVDTSDEIKPVAGRLILQEGEITGHHHAITLADPRSKRFRRETEIGDPLAAGRMLSATLARKAPSAPLAKAAVATARMYRDPRAGEAMVRAKVLDRSDLMVGLLVVEGGPAVVRHEEHDGIRVPEGRYYVGRQVESVGADERRVAD